MNGQEGLIVDAKIITDGRCLDVFNNDKVKTYRRDVLIEKLKEQKSIQSVSLFAVTLNFRGIWSPAFTRFLVEREIMKKDELTLISLRTIMGTYIYCKIFNNSTAVSSRVSVC